MLRAIFIASLWLLATGCSSGKYPYPVHKVDEFVIDSYKIRQGKTAILALEGTQVEPLSPSLLEEYRDTIDTDDILEIAVYHPLRTDVAAAVNEVGRTVGYGLLEGKIFLPNLAPVHIEGLSLEEARLALETAYRQEVNGIEVFVSYKVRPSRKVQILGHKIEVPSIPVDGKLRLFDVLSKSRMPSDVNLFMSYVVRDTQWLPVDMYKLIKEGDMSQNIVMRGKDKVFLASTADATAMVMGEVGHPIIVPLPNGYTSLISALVEARGIPFTGNKSNIQVIRGNIVNPKIYLLNWTQIVQLPNDSLLLMPGDTVYVSEKPITQWNRFIDQLLPTFCGMHEVNRAGVDWGWY